MNFSELQKKLKEDFNWIDNDAFSKIEIYKSFLQKENKKFNLTRLDSEEKIYEEYFYESIFVYKNIIKNKQQRILDVGSGSGIPGILIAIVFDKSHITIVEPSQKKCNFMTSLIEILVIKNVTIINERAECIGKSFRDFFDIGTSRAVAPLNVIIEIIVPYLKVNGILIQPKSIQLISELENSQIIMMKLNLLEDKIIEKKLNNKVHKILILRKIKETNLRYPRKWKEILND